MKRKTVLFLLIILAAVFLAGTVCSAEAVPDLEAVYSEMSIEELVESEALLQRILNEKRIAGAVLIAEPSAESVAVGKSLKIAVSSDGREITKKTQITYETSDPEIATVKAGTVTGKGPGTVTIKAIATFEDDAVLEASCDVTVIVPVTGIKAPTKGSVFTGDTLDVASLVTIAPENASEQGVTYEVSDPELAEISEDGVLKGKKAGSVVVLITSKENIATPKAAKIAVAVNQAVQSIELSDTTFNVGRGKTYALKPVVGPSDATNQKVTWSSDDPAIAKVSATGVVTGVGTGTTTIICTAADGSEITASAKVTVITSVSALRMGSKEMTLIEGKTNSVSCTVTPEDASNKKLEWSSDNSSIATVDSNGKVTAKKAGTCKITATATDGSNKSATCVVYVEPKVPVFVTSIHWQTTWGVNNGRMGVLAESYCVHKTIKSFDYTVKCYIGSYSSDPVVSYMHYDGQPIYPGKSAKSKLSSGSVSGFKSASIVEIIPTMVYFSDGTSMSIEKADQRESTFDMR